MKKKIPRESETIAARRAVRVAEKLKLTRERFLTRRVWWNNGPIEFLGVAVAFGLNVYLVAPFLGTPAVDTTFSGPIIPLLASALGLFGLPFDYAVQIVNMVFFVLFPITLYILIKKISGRKLVALFVVLLATLPIWPFAKTRIMEAFLSLEGPHMVSLAIVPLAVYGLLVFLKEGTFKNLLMAAVAASGVVLISPFGFLTYVIFAGITTFSEILLGQGRLKISRLLAVFLVTAGLSSFWYHPSFFWWVITERMDQDIVNIGSRLLPVSFFLLPVLGAFGYLLFDRRPNLQSLFLSGFFTIAFFLIVVAGGGLVPSLPFRYMAELGMSVAFLLGIGLTKLADALAIRLGRSNLWVAGMFVILAAVPVLSTGLESRPDNRVLRMSVDANKGELWLARERYGGIPAGVGYGVTLLTVGGVAFVGLKPTIGLLIHRRETA